MKQRRSWWSGSSVPPISRFTFFHVWFDVRSYVSWHCDDAIAVCSRTANYEHDDDDDDDIAFRDSSLVCCVFAAYFDLYDMIATFAVVNVALHFFSVVITEPIKSSQRTSKWTQVRCLPIPAALKIYKTVRWVNSEHMDSIQSATMLHKTRKNFWVRWALLNFLCSRPVLYMYRPIVGYYRNFIPCKRSALYFDIIIKVCIARKMYLASA